MDIPERLAKRGDAATTALAHEFGMHEYVWPRVLGGERWKWKGMAAVINKAALCDHKHACHGTMADGRTRCAVPSFAGDHADMHRGKVRRYYVVLLDTGIPRFLTEPEGGHA